MCFAMREGIVHQQLDVCGDVETNVNERRTTTANPLSFFHVPLPQETNLHLLTIPSTEPLYTDFIYFSLLLSLTNVRILLSFRICCNPYLHTYTDLLYSSLCAC